MNPTIASSIAAQRQHDLLATAEHYRRIHRRARTLRGRQSSVQGTVRGHPNFRFPAWLAAGRL